MTKCIKQIGNTSCQYVNDVSLAGDKVRLAAVLFAKSEMVPRRTKICVFF